MDQRVSLKIGRIGFTIESEADDRDRIPITADELRRGLEILGRRLASSPFGRSAMPQRLVLERIALEPLSLDELAGPRGAERLADMLYAQLVGGR
jgi:hypothetical protein